MPLVNISIIQDAINTFLADNPEFISQIIFEEESELVESKKLTLDNKNNI